jgi:glutamate dehydrogenase (NAD(P)+)
VGRDQATSRGAWNATEQLLRRGAVPGLHTLEGARVAVQGYGNAGSVAARVFHKAGSVIVAVSDSRGGIASGEGLDPQAVLDHKRETGSVIGFPGAQTISNAELLACDCDILIPAALECQVTEANAHDVKAKLIVEAANGPLTSIADLVLLDKGVVVLPDILANAGGVVVSYFEWVQNLQNQKWNLDKVERLLNDKMCRAVDQTVDRCDELRDRYDQGENPGSSGPTLRDAALVNAISSIAEVIVQRDIWP